MWTTSMRACVKCRERNLRLSASLSRLEYGLVLQTHVSIWLIYQALEICY